MEGARTLIIFYLFISIIVLQRIIEVIIANRNTKWVEKQGGYEVGKEHYKYIVGLHVLFFLSLIIEVNASPPTFYAWTIIPLVIFILAQFGRAWALSSLGRFWNTRVMILPGSKVVVKGPYRYFRHPNYIIVAIEILTLPIIFQAYWTAVTFTILNACVLSVRIKAEEAALKEVTDYEKAFS